MPETVELSQARYDRGCQCWDCYAWFSRSWLDARPIPDQGRVVECPDCGAMNRVLVADPYMTEEE